jgi:hypothetical protein
VGLRPSELQLLYYSLHTIPDYWASIYFKTNFNHQF